MTEHTTISPAVEGALLTAANEPAANDNKPRHKTNKEFLQQLNIQCRLSVGAVDDPLEHEADAMADKVMRMPEPAFIQRKCSGCEEEEKIHRKPFASFIQKKETESNSMAGDAVYNQVQSTKGKGNALPDTTKSFMESRFATNFSGVHIHTGSDAVQLSNGLNAQAFTIGNDIYFNQGKFSPESSEGKHLLAHELTHTIQQNTIAQNSSPYIQREMKFEFQTKNKVYRNDGKHVEQLERKFGPEDFLVKGKTGVRLESESDEKGVLEFETEWFRKWSSLKEQIEEAVEMTKKMSSAPDTEDGRKQFPFDSDIDHLRKGTRAELKKGEWEWRQGKEGAHEKILKENEKLEIKIVDTEWLAFIQSSEGILLTQFESLFKEHQNIAPGDTTDDRLKNADEIWKVSGASKDFPALQSFLQLIVHYIWQGQNNPLTGEDRYSKAAFTLMSRTSFSSIFEDILTEDEQALFKNIVDKQLILKQLGLKTDTRFFIEGHSGGAGPTIHNWLKSIIKPVRKTINRKGKPVIRDLLSNPIKGSASMGAFDVETERGKKDTGLVKFETRNTRRKFEDENIKKLSPITSIRVQPATNWVAYAAELFKFAAENRKRPEMEDDPLTTEDETDKTTLKFDEDKIVSKAIDEAGSKLTLKVELSTAGAFEVGVKYNIYSLLNGRLKPFIYGSVGTSGLSAELGATVTPINEMSVFLTGQAGIRSDWFKSLEVGEGLEAGWAFGDKNSLRLGVGWETWKKLDSDEKRSHLFKIFAEKTF